MLKIFTLNSRINAKLAGQLDPEARQQKKKMRDEEKKNKKSRNKLQKKRPTVAKRSSSSFSLSCLSVPHSQPRRPRILQGIIADGVTQREGRKCGKEEKMEKVPSIYTSSTVFPSTSTLTSLSPSLASSSSRPSTPLTQNNPKPTRRHQKQQEQQDLLAQHIGLAITTQAHLLLPRTTNPLLKKYTSFHLQNTRITSPSLESLDQKVTDRALFFSRLMGERVGGGTVVVEQGEGKEELVEAVQDLGDKVAGWVEGERGRIFEKEWEDGRVGRRRDKRRDCGVWGEVVRRVGAVGERDGRDRRRDCGVWEELVGRGVVESEGDGEGESDDEDDWYDADSEWLSL